MRSQRRLWSRRTDVARAESRTRSGSRRAKRSRRGEMNQPIEVEVNRAGTVVVVSIPIAGTGKDSASKSAVHALRDDVVPATVGVLPDAHHRRRGMMAQSRRSSTGGSRRRVGLRARVRSDVRGDAARLPLDCDRAKAIVLERALGRGRLRHTRARLPGWHRARDGSRLGPGGIETFLPIFSCS